jgi:hypothetical protein
MRRASRAGSAPLHLVQTRLSAFPPRPARYLAVPSLFSLAEEWRVSGQKIGLLHRMILAPLLPAVSFVTPCGSREGSPPAPRGAPQLSQAFERHPEGG